MNPADDTCFAIETNADFQLSVDGCEVTNNPSGCQFNPAVLEVPPVGGTVELLGQPESPADASKSSARDYAAPIAAAVAAGAVTLVAGGWYARRRLS